MKKIVLSLLILLCFSLLGTSAIILTGCGETQSENGGTSDPETENPENPEEGEANWTSEFDIKIVAREYTSYTNYTDASSSSGNISAGYFNVSWWDESDKSGNMTVSNGAGDYIAAKGKSVSKDGTHAYSNLQYLHYSYNHAFSYKRYMKVNVGSTASGWYGGFLNTVGYCPSEDYGGSTWYIYDSNCGVPKPSSGSITTKNKWSGYITYYKKYNIYYYNNYNNSDTSLYTSSSYVCGEYRYRVAGSASRTGYTFLGWGTSRSGGTVYSSTGFRNTNTHSDSNSDHYYYAQWGLAQYRLFADCNGGTWSSTPSGWDQYTNYPNQRFKYIKYTYTYGTLPSSSYLYKTGYSLSGWSTSSSASSSNVTSSTTMGTSETTIYAVWKINSYSLIADCNGGSWSSSNPSGWSNVQNKPSQKYKNVTYKSTYGSLPSSTYLYKTGYTFNGWSTSSSASSSNVSTSTTMGTSSVIIYAVWNINSYTLYANCNGGTWSSTPSEWRDSSTNEKKKSVTYKSTYGTLPSSSYLYKTGYSLSGWATSSSASSTNVTSSTTMGSSSTTIYAVWGATPRTITVKIYTSTTGANSYSENKDEIGGTVKLTYTKDNNKTPTSASATSTGTSLSVTALQNFAATIDCTASSGYKYMGFSTTNSASYSYNYTYAPNTSVSVNSGTSNVTYYVYFKKEATKVYKDGSYFYINYGMFPKTKYTSITGGETTGSKMTIKGVAYDIYKDSSNNYYLKYNNAYFKFEPIKWRILGSGLGNYGSYVGNVTLISDQVLYADAIVTDVNSIDTSTSNWSFTNSNIYKNIQSLAGIGTFGIANSNKSIANDYFPNPADANYANKVGTATVSSSNLRVASKDEIKSVYGSATSPATATDFAAEILKLNGDTTAAKDTYTNYWTRNLWAYNANGHIVTKDGTESNLALDQVSGVRLAFTIDHATFWG